MSSEQAVNYIANNPMEGAVSAPKLLPEENGMQKPLREYVKQALKNYFANLDGVAPAFLYDMVLEEIEIPLLEAVMVFVRGNQSKAAKLLGISRGTLRKKLKIYGMLD